MNSNPLGVGLKALATRAIVDPDSAAAFA